MYELCFLYCFKCRLCISINTGFRTKSNINTLGYTFNGSHFACNIFNLIILVKPVFILHGAFWSYFSHEHLTSIKPTLIQLSTLLMLATKWLAFGINTIPADALAPKVSNASAGMLLVMYDSEYVLLHYDDVRMGAIASQITSLAIVYSAFYSGVDQRKRQSSASLAFVREIHRGPVNFPHKWPVTRKMFPFDDVIMV